MLWQRRVEGYAVASDRGMAATSSAGDTGLYHGLRSPQHAVCRLTRRTLLAKEKRTTSSSHGGRGDLVEFIWLRLMQALGVGLDSGTAVQIQIFFILFVYWLQSALMVPYSFCFDFCGRTRSRALPVWWIQALEAWQGISFSGEGPDLGAPRYWRIIRFSGALAGCRFCRAWSAPSFFSCTWASSWYRFRRAHSHLVRFHVVFREDQRRRGGP
eukprot:TRINITY_DN21040_c0_g1_i1.p1 TRINITY_DN21040_c0_g1~~TRINITY_DN21040_c0_g1_i1.p1  ORF type:complete len:213 (-),score=8.07 TRINITY_DN21040_c0_g1_i1:862-1500(-)